MCMMTMCCCLQMMGTDLLIALAMIVVWELPLICPILFLLLFGFIDSIFWTANLTKIPLGGWFAVTVAAAVCLFSYIWFLGTSLKRQYAVEHEVRLLTRREVHTLPNFVQSKQYVIMLAFFFTYCVRFYSTSLHGARLQIVLWHCVVTRYQEFFARFQDLRRIYQCIKTCFDIDLGGKRYCKHFPLMQSILPYKKFLCIAYIPPSRNKGVAIYRCRRITLM
jgi:hypothetical protein